MRVKPHLVYDDLYLLSCKVEVDSVRPQDIPVKPFVIPSQCQGQGKRSLIGQVGRRLNKCCGEGFLHRACAEVLACFFQS